MVAESGKATGVTEAVTVKYVATVEEDVVAIYILPLTTVTVLISKIFIGILEVPIGMLFRETVDHLLAANADVKDGGGCGNDGVWGGHGHGGGQQISETDTYCYDSVRE